MRGEPRYALEKFDAVLRSMGCNAETSAADHQTRAWVNPQATNRGVPPIATFRTDSGEISIGHSSVVSVSMTLGLDPREVLRELAASGGEILDP